MTREEFRDKKSKDYRRRRESYGIKDPVYLDEIEEAYYQGMVDADAHPHWISVADEFPPKEDDSLDLSVDVLATNGNEVYKTFYDYYLQQWVIVNDFNLDDITHWMPLPSVEHLKKGDKK